MEEINTIFDELLIIKDKHCINKVIIPGDSFEKINPTSKELDCLSTFLKKLNLPIILLAANSHESTTQTESIINHFGILTNTINVVKEYQDNNKLFVGHFIINQSSKNYGGIVDSKTLKQFQYVILGHGHNFEIIKPNIIQLSSIRYVDFGEDPKIPKMVGICKDYESPQPNWEFLPLNSPYLMINIELGKNEQIKTVKDPTKSTKDAVTKPQRANPSSFLTISDLSVYLDQLNPKTKVRVIFKDYGSYREFLPLSEKYRNKFTVFKDKKEFILNLESASSKKDNVPLKESLINWMEKNKVPDEIKKVLLEEIK